MSTDGQMGHLAMMSSFIDGERVQPLPISIVIDECIAAKKWANRRPIYIHELRRYLKSFAAGRESVPVSEFTTATLEQWFDARNESPVTRRGSLSRISVLFSFAKRRGYIASNPCERLERISVDPRPPRIFTPAEAASILRFVRRRLKHRLAYIVLGIFCGIRPTELQRIRWTDINLQNNTVRIDAAASKVRQRRIVPIPDNAAQWLKTIIPNHQPIGCKGYKWLHRIEEDTGIQWHQDILRHTAASYLVAKHEDVGRVARWLGNSADILLRNYTELVTPEDCAAFWSIMP